MWCDVDDNTMVRIIPAQTHLMIFLVMDIQAKG